MVAPCASSPPKLPPAENGVFEEQQQLAADFLPLTNLPSPLFLLLTPFPKL